VGFQKQISDKRTKQVACLGCGGSMKLVCKMAKAGVLREIHVFICTPCCEVTAKEL
jgi:hypothetical protein